MSLAISLLSNLQLMPSDGVSLTGEDEFEETRNSGRRSRSTQSLLTKPFKAIFSFFALLGTFFMDVFDKFLLFVHRMTPQPAIRINNRSFQIIKPLGEGGFSFVYLVKESGSTGLFALKKVRLQLPEQVDRFKGEVAAMKSVKSPHVVKLEESAVLNGRDGQPLEGLILLQFYSNGTIQDLIDRTPSTDYIPLRLILQYSIDIYISPTNLESSKQEPPHAFRDLKPANVLLDDQDRAVLMDLGSVAPARVRISTRRDAVALQDVAAETVTAPFRAPELFDPPTNSTVDERTDSWALGCTIFAMAFRTSPFDGSMTAAVGGKIPFPTKTDPYGKAFRTLLQMILVTDMKTRPTVEQISKKLQSLQSSLQLESQGP
ncbi:hypothetical protein HK096_007574 [Nowakowskiella sp. JEL0078]|nr:hypothetical protein HK096_007574 [Nowakowskiella sp. JEL0078]